MRVKDLTACAMFVALIIIGAQLHFPLPLTQVPVTLQTFMIYLIVLSASKGVAIASVLAYLLLGALGLPVFSGFTGGLGILFGATGGYLWAFIPGVIMALFIPEGKGLAKNVIKIAIVTLCVYSLGAIQLMMVSGITLKTSIVTGVLPFLPGDFLKGALALALAKRIKNAKILS